MTRTTLLAAVAAGAMLPATAMAQDAATYQDKTPAAVPQKTVADGPKISFGVSGATDYVWRGVSQSDDHAAVFATVNVGLQGPIRRRRHRERGLPGDQPGI